MPNYEGWRDKLSVISVVEDSGLSPGERQVLRDVFLPISVALAGTVSRSQLYYDLAECQMENRCSPLKYDPEKKKFVFTRDGKERELDPALFVERGLKVCRRKDTGDVYIRWGKPIEGLLAVSYGGVVCDPGDETLGMIHVHPAGAVFPSGEDMFSTIFAKHHCIAGRVYDPKAKKDYARVLCYVTDDVFLYDASEAEERMGYYDLTRIVAEFPDLFRLKSEYESKLVRAAMDYNGKTLRVIDGNGSTYVYVFPPSSFAVLRDLVNISKDTFKDSHRFELYVVDLSESEPPSLSELEK